MSERRKYDHIPKEIRDYIQATAEVAADAGAEKAVLKLAFEISRTGIKKVLYAIGAAVVGLLSAMTYWFTHGPPK